MNKKERRGIIGKRAQARVSAMRHLVERALSGATPSVRTSDVSFPTVSSLRSGAASLLKTLPLQAKKLALAATITGAVFAPALPGFAQPPAQDGTEFKVNTTVSGDQILPDVAQNSSGAFVAVWYDDDEDEIVAQRYNSSGVAQGGEILVAESSVDTEFIPLDGFALRVAMDDDGDFVVAWQGRLDSDPGPEDRVYFRRFDSTGTAQGSATVAPCESSTAELTGPGIAMDDDGDFVLSWVVNDELIDAQRYNSAGVAQGTTFMVHSVVPVSGPEAIFATSAAMDSDGDFVIAWNQVDYDDYASEYYYSVYARRYTSAGAAEGSAFEVANGGPVLLPLPPSSPNPDPDDFAFFSALGGPDVAMDDDGDFVVTWDDFYGFGFDLPTDAPDGFGAPQELIYARRYSNTGAAQGAEFLVSRSIALAINPVVAMDDDGDFAIAWMEFYGAITPEEELPGFDIRSVQARYYNAAGAPSSDQFRVNTHTANDQDHPGVGMDSEGSFVVVWQSEMQDAYTDGIYGQRYNAPVEALAFVSGTRTPSLIGAYQTAVSPNGSHVYAAGCFTNSISIFDRNGGNCDLTFNSLAQNGTGGVSDLELPTSVAISPDASGSHVYATGMQGNSVVAFSRNNSTGALTFIESEVEGSGGVSGMLGAHNVTVSPDGMCVYVASIEGDAVAAFMRNTSTGHLTFIESEMDGYSADGLDGAAFVAVSPDNDHVYVAGRDDNAVAVFSRDGYGSLTFVEVVRQGVNGVQGLLKPMGIAISSDGSHVYVTGSQSNAVVAFSRNSSTGALTFIEREANGFNGVGGMSGAFGVIVSPDGSTVYVTGERDNSLAVFDRNTTTGAIEFDEQATNGFNSVTDFVHPRYISIDANGGCIYAPAFQSSAVVVFSD